MSDFPSILRRAALCAALGCSALLFGCNIIGYVANAVGGQPEQPAQYTPDKLLPMVVIAENWKDPASSSLDAEQLVRYVNEELKEKKVAPMIDPMTVSAMATTRPTSWRQATIPEIGRAVGARQVVYIDIISDIVTHDGGTGMISASTSARVRVVDATNGATLWPTDASAGWPVTYQSPMYDTSRPDINEVIVRQKVQKAVGAQVARLFYNFKPD